MKATIEATKMPIFSVFYPCTTYLLFSSNMEGEGSMLWKKSSSTALTTWFSSSLSGSVLSLMQ